MTERVISWDVDGRETGKRDAGHFKGISLPAICETRWVPGIFNQICELALSPDSGLVDFLDEPEVCFCGAEAGIFIFLKLISCQSGGEIPGSPRRKTRRSD